MSGGQRIELRLARLSRARNQLRLANSVWLQSAGICIHFAQTQKNTALSRRDARKVSESSEDFHRFNLRIKAVSFTFGQAMLEPIGMR
jgi:hypothetical protein